MIGKVTADFVKKNYIYVAVNLTHSSFFNTYTSIGMQKTPSYGAASITVGMGVNFKKKRK